MEWAINLFYLFKANVPFVKKPVERFRTANHVTSFYAISVLALNNLETHNMKSTTSLKRSDFCFFMRNIRDMMSMTNYKNICRFFIVVLT